MKSISIAAPVFNEELNISNCIEAWMSVINELSINEYEIVLCDDKSTDDSINVIEKHISKNPNIKLVKHAINQGAAQAVISAGNNATKERILFVDSDGQFPRESILEVIKASNLNPEVCVFGARETKEDSLLTQTGTRLTTLIFNIIYGKKLSDISCILKIIPYNKYKNLNLESTGLNVSTEMSCKILESDCEINEVKVQHRAREFGTSSAAGYRFIKHGIKRIGILKYFFYRKILILCGIISPPKP
jgi:glycosyltransferase involved in cell wall biosynthesis